jgi:replicative DNA helicase
MADLTPRELAERSLVGALLWQPGRVAAIASWLDPEDFRSPVNAAVFAHVRDMVAEVRTAGEAAERASTAYVIYHARYDSGPQHSRLIPESLEILRVSRLPFAQDALEVVREATGLGYDVHEHPVTVSPDVPDDALAAAAADVIRNLPAFDFWTDVVGDDLVVDGVVYDADQYALDPEGGVRELTPDEHADRDAQHELEYAEDEAARYSVPGVTPQTILARMQEGNELREGGELLNAPYLHTLMATASRVRGRQPETYALYIAESSVRRDIERSGMRVAQAADANLELGALIAAVDTALNHVDALHQRWRAVTEDRSISTGLAAGGGSIAPIEVPRVDPDTITSDLDLFAPAPDEQTLIAAEESLLGRVLATPAALGTLIDRLLPEDFTDSELGNSYRAAIEVYAASRRGGPQVDAVTVAWEQQRHIAQHGPGASAERLLTVLDQHPLGSPDYVVDLVMRGRLARLTADAAQAVQQAAQHPGLQPADVLHTSRLAYQAVRVTADRMTGQASATSRMSGIATNTLDPQPSPPAATSTGRSSAQVLTLREKAASLRARVTVPADTVRSDTGPTQAPVSDLASRLSGELASRIGHTTPGTTPAWPAADEPDPTTDYGPEL